MKHWCLCWQPHQTMISISTASYVFCLEVDIREKINCGLHMGFLKMLNILVKLNFRRSSESTPVINQWWGSSKCNRSTYYYWVGRLPRSWCRQVQSLNWVFRRRCTREASTHKSLLPSKINDFGRDINTGTWYFSSELIPLIGARSIKLIADEN